MSKLEEAELLTFNGETEEKRILALAYWLDRQNFRPDMLSTAAETLRVLLRRTQERTTGLKADNNEYV